MTNLKVLAVVLVTLGVYTWIANAIPQIESAVPTAVSFSAEVTEAELVAAGEELYHGGAGCVTCHGLPDRAPNLLTDYSGEGPIGARCATRVEGQDCKTYLYESIVDPGAFVFGDFDPMVFAAAFYSPSQIWAVVAYLQAQGGEVTVTGEDIVADEGAAGGAAPTGGGGVVTASTDPIEIMRSTLCFGCHVLGDEGVAVGPPLDGIGARFDADYLRRSILDPGAEAAEGYEHLLGSMPPNLADMMTARQLEIVLDYLARQE
ncbi:MAG TPA: c-type cytochrome [Longimicrobiaceae bacterium]|nr:c-type cytochrome [Longimicrobiaceae bacterium]